VAEECFHDGVVKAGALARHRLSETGVLQGVAPQGVAVLKSLVRVKPNSV
jgi:hypothetical protein